MARTAGSGADIASQDVVSPGEAMIFIRAYPTITTQASTIKQNGLQKEKLRNNGCNEYIDLFRQFDWDLQTILRICNAESGGNPNAFNATDRHKGCTGSYGLMQVGCLHAPTYGYTVEDLFNPVVNISVGYQVFRSQGYKAWSVY